MEISHSILSSGLHCSQTHQVNKCYFITAHAHVAIYYKHRDRPLYHNMDLILLKNTLIKASKALGLTGPETFSGA